MSFDYEGSFLHMSAAEVMQRAETAYHYIEDIQRSEDDAYYSMIRKKLHRRKSWYGLFKNVPEPTEEAILAEIERGRWSIFLYPSQRSEKWKSRAKALYRAASSLPPEAEMLISVDDFNSVLSSWGNPIGEESDGVG